MPSLVPKGSGRYSVCDTLRRAVRCLSWIGQDWITCSCVCIGSPHGYAGYTEGRAFGSIPLSSCILFCIVGVVQIALSCLLVLGVG